MEPGYPGTNAVFILDQTYVVKIYAPFCHEDYDLERELYPLLERNPCIPAPALIAHGILHDRIQWPYIVMDSKPGKPIREVRREIARANRIEIASCMGQIVRELHRTPLGQVHGLDSAPGGWMRFAQARRTDCVGEHREEGVLPEAVIEQIPTLFEFVEGDLKEPSLVLLNGDLTEDHLLVERQNGRWRVSGLIDFADAFIGQREYEWIALWFGALDREAECLRAFMESYDPSIKLDEQFSRRAMAFTFLHEFGAGIVVVTLRRLGNPPVRSMQQLREVLWRM